MNGPAPEAVVWKATVSPEQAEAESRGVIESPANTVTCRLHEEELPQRSWATQVTVVTPFG